jgi:hypothetical protein
MDTFEMRDSVSKERAEQRRLRDRVEDVIVVGAMIFVCITFFGDGVALPYLASKYGMGTVWLASAALNAFLICIGWMLKGEWMKKK